MSAFGDLAYIRDYVCAKQGQRDQTTKDMVDAFVLQRYRMTYDSFDWIDSQIDVTIGLTGPDNVIPMPTGMDRVVAIRSNGDTFLEPASIGLLMQTDPTIFERVGLPSVYYEKYDDGLAEHQIIVLPQPPSTLDLFIVGKRTLPALSIGTDVPIIRNIDNVLIAYATGDLLERQRQYGAAKLKFDEAGAMLEAAKSLERTQTNKQRIAKETSAGNSLAALIDAVRDKTGMWGLEYIGSIKASLRRQYQKVWDACNWSEATVCATVNSDGGEMILPVYFDRLLSIRADANLGQLVPVEAGLYFGIAPSIFEQTGSAVAFSYLTSVGVKALPPTREKLSFVSSWATDEKKAFVQGEVRGEEVSETVTLNGHVPVQTSNEYDTPLKVSKEVTRGTVSVTGATSGTALLQLLPAELERRHMRIWMQPTPVATVCLALGKRKIEPFVTNEDVPLLRDIQNILIAATSAEMFAKAGNDKAAADARDEASTALQTMISLETQQGAYSACVVPEVEPYGYGEYAEYGYSKGYW